MNSKTDRPGVDLTRLASKELAELRRLHRDLFGSDCPMPNGEHLRRKVAYQIQATAEGGLPQSARQHAFAIARTVPVRSRVGARRGRSANVIPFGRSVMATVMTAHDSRLPLPGSCIVREFKGRTIIVRVLDDGFEYDGRQYASLSAIAQKITGTKWNGFLFFGLTKESRRAS